MKEGFILHSITEKCTDKLKSAKEKDKKDTHRIRCVKEGTLLKKCLRHSK